MAQVEVRVYGTANGRYRGLLVARLYPPEPGPGGFRYPSQAHLLHPFRVPKLILEQSV